MVLKPNEDDLLKRGCIVRISNLLAVKQQRPAGVVPLRPASVAAGLGIYRKNNFFYGPKGSNYELVAYLIDKSCEYIQNLEIFLHVPDSCDLCQQGCKTKSLSAPFTMNPMTCVLFINTFGDGNMPEGVTEDMLEEWIIGV